MLAAAVPLLLLTAPVRPAEFEKGKPGAPDAVRKGLLSIVQACKTGT